MDCDRCKELLAEYELGELDAVTRAEVEAALSTCADCRAELAMQQRLLAAVAELPQLEFDPGRRASVMSEAVRVAAAARRPADVAWYRHPAFAMAAAALVAVGGTFAVLAAQRGAGLAPQSDTLAQLEAPAVPDHELAEPNAAAPERTPAAPPPQAQAEAAPVAPEQQAATVPSSVVTAPPAAVAVGEPSPDPIALRNANEPARSAPQRLNEGQTGTLGAGSTATLADRSADDGAVRGGLDSLAQNVADAADSPARGGGGAVAQVAVGGSTATRTATPNAAPVYAAPPAERVNAAPAPAPSPAPTTPPAPVVASTGYADEQESAVVAEAMTGAATSAPMTDDVPQREAARDESRAQRDGDNASRGRGRAQAAFTEEAGAAPAAAPYGGPGTSGDASVAAAESYARYDWADQLDAGLSLYRSARYAEAAAMLEAYVAGVGSGDPRAGDAQFHLGAALWAMGETRRAGQILRNYLAEFPTHAQADRAREIIAEIDAAQPVTPAAEPASPR